MRNLIEFPTSTKIHKRLPKDAFYKRLSLSKELQDKFVSDVERIVVENSLSMQSLNLEKESEIAEIILLTISLKKQDFDSKLIEAIAKQNPHKLVFLLTYEDKSQLAVYHKKLHRTQWINTDDISLKLSGFSIDEIWESFVEQIAIHDENAKSAADLSIEQRLALQEDIAKLEKLIKRTEAAAWKEKQPKKKFELYSKLTEYRKKLEDLLKYG